MNKIFYLQISMMFLLLNLTFSLLLKDLNFLQNNVYQVWLLKHLFSISFVSTGSILIHQEFDFGFWWLLKVNVTHGIKHFVAEAFLGRPSEVWIKLQKILKNFFKSITNLITLINLVQIIVIWIQCISLIKKFVTFGLKKLFNISFRIIGSDEWEI